MDATASAFGKTYKKLGELMKMKKRGQVAFLQDSV